MEQRPIRGDHSLPLRQAQKTEGGRSRRSPEVMLVQGRRSPSNKRRSPSNSRTPSPSLTMLAAAAGRRSPSHHQRHHHSGSGSSLHQGRHRGGRSPDMHRSQEYEGSRTLARSKSRTRRISSRSQDSPSGEKQMKSTGSGSHGSSSKLNTSKHGHSHDHHRSSSVDVPVRKNSDPGGNRSGSKHHSRSASAENPSKRMSPSEASGAVTLDDALLLNSSRHTSVASSAKGKGHAEDLRAVQAQMQQKAAEVIASSTAGSVMFSGRRQSARQQDGAVRAERDRTSRPQDAMTQTLCNAMTQVDLSDEDDGEHQTHFRVIEPTPRDGWGRSGSQNGRVERSSSAHHPTHMEDAEVRGLGLSTSETAAHKKQHSPSFSKTQSPLEGVVNNVEDMALEEIEMLEELLRRRKSQLRGASGNDDGSNTVVKPQPQHHKEPYSKFRSTTSPKHAWVPPAYSLSSTDARDYSTSSTDVQTGGESAVEQRSSNMRRMDSLENLADLDRKLEHHHQQLVQSFRPPLHGINEHDVDDIEPDSRTSYQNWSKHGNVSSNSSSTSSHEKRSRRQRAQGDYYRKTGGANCPNTKMFSSAMDAEIKRLFLEYGDLERAMEVRARQKERERYHKHQAQKLREDPAYTDHRHHDRMPTHGRRPHGNYHMQDPQRRRASVGGGLSSRSHRSSSPSSSYISSEGMSCCMVSPRSPHTEFGYAPPPSFVPRIRLEALHSPRPEEEVFRSPDFPMSIGVLSSPRSAFTPRSNTSNSSTSTPRPLY